MRPPRLPRWLLARLLPHDHRSVVVGELDEEFDASLTGGRSRLSASLSYWKNAMTSVPGALKLRTRAFWTDIAGDLRYGWRLLWRNPAFAFAAVLTFALGIATASAVLTVANAVLLRPLPYASPDRVVAVMEFDRTPDALSGNISWPDLLDYQAQNRTLATLAGFNGGSRTLSVPGEATTQVPIMLVTTGFFEVLGVTAARGRTLNADDMPSSAAPVLVLTDRSWRGRFGADPAVVGRTVTLGGRAAQIVGVMPADFEFPLRGSIEFILPEHPSQAQLERKFFHWLEGIGRLRPGVTIAQAEDDLSRIARGFAASDPRTHSNSTARVVPIRDRIVGNVRPTLLLLSVASLVVLIVACANIASLLLARSAVRVEELSLRAALGAGRLRLSRQLLAEQLALAIPSGLLGIAGGYWMTAAVLTTMPPARRLSLPHLASLRLDATAVAISVALTMAATLLFGLLPAMRAARRTHVPFAHRITGAGAHEVRLQSVFVAVQVALALVLLVGAGLMTQSTRRLLDVSPGFNPKGLLTLTVVLPGSRYSNRDAIRVASEELLGRLQTLPGVISAATIDDLPLTGPGSSGRFTVRGDASARETIALVRTVSPNYFDTLGIPRETGRGFDPGAGSTAPPAVLINRVLADRAFAGEAIGQHITFSSTPGVDWEVIGVVGNEQFDALDHELRPVVYFSSVQTPNNVYSVAIRTSGEAAALAGLVRAEVARMDGAIPVFGVDTMETIMRSTESVYRRRSVLALIGVFAAATLVLAAVGLYGVLAQVVAQRRREIGVRIALGAAGSDVVRTVVGRGLLAVGLGLLVGLAASAFLARSLDGLLYRTSPTDPATFALVTGVLVVTALAACLIPARRALGVDPARALRDER